MPNHGTWQAVCLLLSAYTAHLRLGKVRKPGYSCWVLSTRFPGIESLSSHFHLPHFLLEQSAGCLRCHCGPPLLQPTLLGTPSLNSQSVKSVEWYPPHGVAARRNERNLTQYLARGVVGGQVSEVTIIITIMVRRLAYCRRMALRFLSTVSTSLLPNSDQCLVSAGGVGLTAKVPPPPTPPRLHLHKATHTHSSALSRGPLPGRVDLLGAPELTLWRERRRVGREGVRSKSCAGHLPRCISCVNFVNIL